MAALRRGRSNGLNSPHSGTSTSGWGREEHLESPASHSHRPAGLTSLAPLTLASWDLAAGGRRGHGPTRHGSGTNCVGVAGGVETHRRGDDSVDPSGPHVHPRRERVCRAAVCAPAMCILLENADLTRCIGGEQLRIVTVAISGGRCAHVVTGIKISLTRIGSKARRRVSFPEA